MVHRSHKRWHPSVKAGDVKGLVQEDRYSNPGNESGVKGVRQSPERTKTGDVMDVWARKGPFDD